MSTIPQRVREQIRAAIRPEMREQFSPVRYPYTYSADFIRNHVDIVPQSIRDALVTIDSRSDAAQAKQMWADELGVHEWVLACELANAYLQENNVQDGPSVKQCGWWWDTKQCPENAVYGWEYCARHEDESRSAILRGA